MTLELTPLTPGYAKLIAGMHHVSFAEPWSEKAMAELLALPGCFGWLAAEDGEPQGFVLARIAADEAEILTLMVLPPYRRNGLAQRLLGEVVEYAKSQAVGTLFLEVALSNVAGRELYTKVGFVQVGRRPRYYANGGDALLLARDL
jgi:ribosomal-protein-alanine N-acetyltransferase